LNNVWRCPQADQIVLNGDPIVFGISFAIASANASAYCEAQSGACSNPLSNLCGDSDGDGLWDLWEEQGVDGDNDGVAETPLPGAAPLRKDVFVELDCLQSDGNGDSDYDDATDHSHCPQSAALDIAVRSFADAPVENLDGTTGIQLHIDVGELFGAGVVTTVTGRGGAVGSYGDLGGGNIIDEAGNEVIPSGAELDPLKAANFDPNRELAFRYALFGHFSAGCSSGFAGSPGNALVVSLGAAPDGSACFVPDANGFSVGSLDQQAGALLHELGHALGRQHGGEQVSNYKRNYLSVMNYAHTFCRVPASPTRPDLVPGGCDYSSVELPLIDESSLDECLGVDGGVLGFGPIDFNGDRKLQGATCPAPNDSSFAADINGQSLCLSVGYDRRWQSRLVEDDVLDSPAGAIHAGPNGVCDTPVADGDLSEVPLLGSEDWHYLELALLRPGDPRAGASAVVEPTAADVEAARRSLSEQARAELSIESSAPATVLPGQQIDYRVTLSSRGRGPALEVAASLLAPDGSVSGASLPALVLGASTQLEQTYVVPADACPMPLIQTTVVEYEDLAGFSAASSGTALSTVLDVLPPDLQLIGPSSVVIECNVGTYAEQGAVASDSCDPEVLVSVAGDAVRVDRPGRYSVVYSAQDDSGNQSSITRAVQVADTTPPALSVSLSPSSLRPPNHELIPIVPTLKVSDVCDPSPRVALSSITSSESSNGTGDGDTASDIVVDAQGRIFLRAERSGNGSDRIYTLTYEATDASGNVRSVAGTVTVPKN
jgi:hypothetical protein